MRGFGALLSNDLCVTAGTFFHGFIVWSDGFERKPAVIDESATEILLLDICPSLSNA